MTPVPPRASASPAPGTLHRVLGSAFGVAIVIGATIGTGILGTPGSIAAALPSAPLFLGAWLVGGLNALCGATIYAELGAMMPRSGGFYVFARRAFGDTAGMLVGYADWINWCLSAAVEILLIGEYLGAMIPAWGHHTTATGVGVFAALLAIQWAGVRWGSAAQQVTSVMKTVALMALVVAALLLPHHAAPASVTPIAVPHGLPLLLAIGVAMPGVVFSYDSYYAIVYCGEEIRDPGTIIPRSIFRGLWLVIAIYLTLNLAFLHVLPVRAMASDSFVGGTVARMIFGPSGDTVIRGIMVIALLGTANAQILAMPRVLFAMSRDGLFPHQATRVTRRGTPAAALALSLPVIGGLLLVGSFDAVLGMDAFLIVSLYLVCFSALFVLRRREPDAPRPYRARGYPWIPALAVLLAVALLIVMVLGNRRGALFTALLLLIGWPASAMARRLIRRSKMPT